MALETGHIDDPEMLDWLVQAFESVQRAPSVAQLAVLDQLLATEVFDQVLATRYARKKRFGSEGADAVLPLLHAPRAEASATEVDELVTGSMHRGRLSILYNFVGMEAWRLFGRMRGEHPLSDRPDLPGDVPYHFGHEGEQGDVRCTLLPNPSHLEAVNPVVVGFARARRAEGSGRAMAVVVHTDASVVGQGVNAELLQLSALSGFEVGGAVHVVINNQIGFTTEPSEARSSRYCTGPWRAVDSLLLHVNGDDVDDVDAVVRAARLAVRFRERFRRDAVIDLVCYRANGHNELDEPRFTQPAYYDIVDKKPSVAALYERRLIQAGSLSEDEARARRGRLRAGLEAALDAAAPSTPESKPPQNRRSVAAPSEAELREVVAALSRTPAGGSMPKMARLMERRLEELEGGVSWPLAEAMAFALALRSGVSVRLCGQDVERGAFSQRHLAAVHPQTGRRSHPMAEHGRHGAAFEVVNSPLSEYAVLGFEYGYALGSNGTLCIWEAQFGDFANGAQIVIDQFLAAGFEKWGQTANLVLLLPHGLKGQGPEHSSARIERLLQLCARDNITVAHPSTPANYFHLLREQASSGERPLFIITPKVLLRLPQARSPLAAFTGDQGFRPVVASPADGPTPRAVVCSGKIAYELEKERQASGATATVIRLERLYPFPAEALVQALQASGATEMLWLQEEPENYGAGLWLTAKLCDVGARTGVSMLPMVARAESASPAGSFHGWRDREQHALLRRALGLGDLDG